MQESINGVVNVHEMEADTVDTVLKYLYSGDIIINTEEEEPVPLSAYVQLWLHADYFQLALLKDEALNHLLKCFLDTASWLWSYRILARNIYDIYEDKWIRSIGNENLTQFNKDLFRAVRLAYTNPTARCIQKALAVCVYAMGTDITKQCLSASMEQIPDFKADMLRVLAGMQFDAGFTSVLEAGDHPGLKNVDLDWTCTHCQIPLRHRSRNEQGVVVDPLWWGSSIWCVTCAPDLRLRFEMVMGLM